MYLNKNRTEGLWLNNLVNARLGGIKWSKQIKALGIWFGIDKSKCENLNCEMKIVQCRNLIDIWNKRYKLTAKIYVFNSVMCCNKTCHKTKQFDVIQIRMGRKK